MQQDEMTLLAEDEELIKHIGNVITQARKRKEITQAELAKRLKTKQSMICAYENGTRRIPITLFLKIALVLDISLGKLLDGNGIYQKDNKKRPSKFAQRLKKIEKLPDTEKRALAKTIDVFLSNQKLKEKNKEN